MVDDRKGTTMSRADAGSSIYKSAATSWATHPRQGAEADPRLTPCASPANLADQRIPLSTVSVICTGAVETVTSSAAVDAYPPGLVARMV